MTAVEDPLIQGIGLLVSFAATFAAAAVGSRSTMASVSTWYVGLRKPAWVPSGRTIGLVWSTLYVLMAVSAWLVWREEGLGAWTSLTLFGLQLVLNSVWSVLFFGQRNPRAAFQEILVLWIAILATLISFWSVTPFAGILLVPYLAWVTFAGNLNRIVWRLNPETD